MILYEDMKPIAHVLLRPIRVLSQCAWKHCNPNFIFILLNALQLLMN